MSFPAAEQVKLPACSRHILTSREEENNIFKVIGLTLLVIKPGSTDPEEDTLSTRPSENQAFLQLSNYIYLREEYF